MKRIIGGLCAVAAVTACTDVTGLRGARASFIVQPVLGELAAFADNADKVRIRVDRDDDGSFVSLLDTSLTIDPDSGTASVDLSVQLVRIPTTFRVRLDAIRSPDDTLFSGEESVQVGSEAAAGVQTIAIPVSYVGPAGTQLRVTPRDTAVVPGASFPIIAVVTDGSGQPVAEPVTFTLAAAADSSRLTLSRLSGVATARSASPGTALVVVRSASGLADTVRVFVGEGVTLGERHRWVVDATRAQDPPGDLGSDLYPFRTIARAIDTAAAGDTVAIGVATYVESIGTSKALVFLGDSSAAGMPTISPTAGGAGQFLVTGHLTLRRLRVADAERGFEVQADTLVASSLVFRSLAGPALSIRSTDRIDLTGVDAADVAYWGVGIDSSGVVHLGRITVANVREVVADSTAGIVARADTVLVDTAGVSGVENGPGLAFRGAWYARVRRAVVSLATRGILTDSTITLDVEDSTSVTGTGGSGIVADVDTLRVTGSQFRDIGNSGVSLLRQGYHVMALTDVSVDSAAFGVAGATAFAVPGTGAHGRRFTLRRSSITGVPNVNVWPGADTVTVDSTVIGQSGIGCGLVLDQNTAVSTVHASQFAHGGFGIGMCTPDPITTGSAATEGIGYASVTATVFEQPYTATHLHADSLVMVDDTIAAVGWGVWQHHEGAPRMAQGLEIRGGRISGTLYQAISADSVAAVRIAGVTVDSAQLCGAGTCPGMWAVEAFHASSVRIDSSRVRNGQGPAVGIRSVDTFVAYADTVSMGDAPLLPSQELPVSVGDVRSTVVRRVRFDGNPNAGVRVALDQPGDTAVVDSSSFSGSGTSLAVASVDSLTNGVTIRGNTFSGAAGPIVDVEPIRFLEFVDNVVTDAGQGALLALRVDTAYVADNQVSNASGTYVVYVANARVGVMENNQIACQGLGTGGIALNLHPGNGIVRNNTVRKCWAAGLSGGGGPTGKAIQLRDNTFLNDGASVAAAVGYQVQGGGWSTVDIVGNTVSGGSYTFSALAAFNIDGVARVDSNVVTGGGGFGLKLRAPTSTARGNTVSGLTVIDTTLRAALQITSGTSVRAVDNRIVGNGVVGLWAWMGAGIVLDSNLIADGTGPGILLNVPVTARLNGIRRNAPYGVIDSAGGSLFERNDIEGNQFGYFNASGSASVDSAAWWGDALGPRCVAGLGCDPASTGDSVSANVVFSPFATAPVIGVPSGMPPPRGSVAAGRFAPGLTIAGARGELLPVTAVKGTVTVPKVARPSSPVGGGGRGAAERHAIPRPEAR